jgi:hypothetical protein
VPVQIVGNVDPNWRHQVGGKCPSGTAGASPGRGWLAPEDAGGVAVQFGEEVLDAMRGGQ